MNTDPASDQAFASPRWRLAALTWSHFLNDGAANFLPGILPVVLIALRLPVALAGTIMAALLFGQALQPLTGWLADRIGGHSLVVLGLAGSSLGGALIAFTPNYWTLVTVLLLIGVSNSCFHPQAMSAARKLGGRRHATAMSVFLAGGAIGRGVGPVVASWVVTIGGIPSLWILALPAVATVPILWHTAPRLAPRHPTAPPVAWRLHRVPLTILVAYSALRSLMIVSAVTFIPILWHQRGGSLIAGASFITTLLVVGIIGNLGGGVAGDRIGRLRVVRAATAAATLLLAGFLLASGPVLWLLIGLCGIALFATLPLTILIGQDILPENRSLGGGLALGLANALGALGVMAFGPLASAHGPAAALWAATGCGFLAFVLALFLPGGMHQRSRLIKSAPDENARA